MFLFILFCNVIVSSLQYEVPEATIEVYQPKGFSVSIPDEEGIKLFAFHGKINEEIEGREAGTFSKDILKAKNGKWTFLDKGTKLKSGDVIYYWTYVEYDDGNGKRGYPKDDQKFTVTDLIPFPGSTATTTTPYPYTLDIRFKEENTSSENPCQPSPTIYKGKSSCKGTLLLNEPFSLPPRAKYWTVEQMLATGPDYEFCIYLNRTENIFIQNRNLIIKPELADAVYGKEFVTKPLDLGESCTGMPNSQSCVMVPDAGFILPPVLSARITTKQKFSFKYGKVEIRAKLLKGDWLYPELFLNPVSEAYGSGYQSGQIRIAFLPGNEKDRRTLQGGAILGSSKTARNYAMKKFTRKTDWSNKFYRFGVIWKPDIISLTVDDEEYGTISPPPGGFASLATDLQLTNADKLRTGSPIAPFDKEMYLTIGVGAGGFSFPDETDGSKPWKNGERLSVKKFHDTQSIWSATWSEQSKIEIAHVKVWAV